MALSQDTLDRRLALRDRLLASVGVTLRADPSPDEDGPSDPGTYVCRPLLNIAQLVTWWASVRKQGEPDLDPNLHITVAHSTTTFPWTPATDSVVVGPGALAFGVLGKDNAVVVFLESPELDARWKATIAAGAVWDFPEYHPHLTLFFLGEEHDAKCAMPWTSGQYPALPTFPLVLGPELMGTLDSDVFTGEERADGLVESGQRFNQNHDTKGEFASGESGASWKSGKVLRALNSYKPSTAAKQRKGEAEQARLATLIGLTNTDDNAPFDLLGGKAAVEVKTLIDNDNDKITVHPASRLRKEAFASSHDLTSHTVAIDTRGNARAYYYKAGVGAYRLGSMERISVADLRSRLHS